MTKYIILLLSLFCFNTLKAQPTHVKIIYFTGSFEDALIESKKVNKPILVKGYADWCGYCRKMEQETISKSGIIDLFNEHFIPLQRDLEKGEGIEIAKKYESRGFPSIIIINPDGSLRTKIVGFKSYPELKDLLIKAVEQVDDTETDSDKSKASPAP